MKRTIVLLTGLLLMNYSIIYCKPSVTSSIVSYEDSLCVLSSPDLFRLSNAWASEYNRLYPEKKIKVVSVSDTKMADRLMSEGYIGFVSNEYYSGFDIQSLWKVVVGRDVIVPVINSKNPSINEIGKQGISTESFTKLFENAEPKNWSSLVKSNLNSKVNYYWINDQSIKAGIASFIKATPDIAGGIEVGSGEELIAAIQKDPYGLGFCKMINTIDYRNQRISADITLLPIDRNGNGMVDYNEKIYEDLNVFSRGVWIGKYPKALFSNIYSVSSGEPKNEKEVAFLKWVLTDGQQFLYNNGYSDLLISERQTLIDKLYIAETYAAATVKDRSLPKTVLLSLISLVVAGLIIDTVVRYRRRKKAKVTSSHIDSHSVLDQNSLVVPKGLYFDKTHTWAFMEQNGVVKVGIDDFLQHITGSITSIKMKSTGKKVKKGDQILSIIQNGKQLNLYSPVTGIIIEQNVSLEKNAGLLNSSPYNEGWIYKIEPLNWHRENQLLFMADKHREFIKNEFSRLKDFLAVTLNADTERFSTVIMQDGGVLRDGILSDLGPEVWDDFQTKFIDPSRQVWFYEVI
jgi:glycine cleavage system H lipoate-binding protein/ABC-type phosphate transport system substrate-binding protein